jgi:hypothetical protein
MPVYLWDIYPFTNLGSIAYYVLLTFKCSEYSSILSSVMHFCNSKIVSYNSRCLLACFVDSKFV